MLATSTLIFLYLPYFLPQRADALEQRAVECNAAFDAGVAGLAAEDSPERSAALRAQFRACLRPVLDGQLTAAGAGLGLLAGVTAAGWLAHPWWLVRRRRLRPLTADTTPALVADLDRLSREIGLRRPPRWLLAPHRRTPSGQAFGLPGRRCVQLDAGLVLLRAHDPPAFRAVVRHELAHLRNRDVDMTYLTMAVWWAFLLVAVLPQAVLLAHPTLLVDPGRWGGPSSAVAEAAGSLLVMTALVYGVRNAVLRARETRADAVAAGYEEPDGALARILGRLPPPRRWVGRWGTHPTPADRLRAVRDPRALVVPSYGELVATGLPAGIIIADLKIMAGVSVGVEPLLGTGLLGLAVGPWLGALLTVTLWRSVAARSAGSARRGPTWLTGPVVLAAASLAGTLLSLQTVRYSPGLPGGTWSWLVAGAVLTAGAVLLGAWVDAAVRAGGAGARPVRWALPAVVVAAGLAGGTALSVWLPYSLVSYGFSLTAGTPPAAGTDIGWYAAVAAVGGGELGPAYWWVFHPLTMPTLAVLAVLPVLLAWRRAAAPPPLGGALAVGVVGGAAVVLANGALPVLARVLLPAEVRTAPGGQGSGEGFLAVLDNGLIAVGSLAVAAALAVVVAGRGPLRPAGALLAAMVAGVIGAAAFFLVAGPALCLSEAAGPAPCVPTPSAAMVSRVVHWIVVQGLMVGAALVLAVAAARLALARRRTDGGPAAVGAVPPRRVGVLAGIGVVALLVVAAWLTWAVLPIAYELWWQRSFD